jgi:hypothetical protein
MDNPTETLNATPIKVRAIDSLSNTTGVVNNFRQALNPSKMITPGPEYFDVADDEMDIKYLTSKWSLVSPASRNVAFTTSSVVGTPIYTQPINPGMLGGTLPNTSSYNAVYRSLLSFMAMRFSRWRGSITFAVEIIATQYQTGKLFLGYSPYYTVPAASSAGNPDLLTNYGMVVEINKGKNVYEVTIPFYCMNEWANVTTFSPSDAIDTDVLGYFYITPVNQLAIMGSVPNAVRLNIYVKGGDDFEFAFPFGTAVGAAVPQGDGVIGQYRRLRGTNTYNDIPVSVRDLLRRPWYWFGTHFTQTGGCPMKYCLIPLDSLFAEGLSATGGVNNRLGGNMGYWASLFRGYVGDLRVKIMLTRETTVGTDLATAKQASSNYPVWCSHLPSTAAVSAADPSIGGINGAVQLWLAQRYSQNNLATTGYAIQADTSVLTPYNVGVNVNNQFAPGIGVFEEVIIDPIKSIEMEIPYNGVARFGTRGELSTLQGIERSAKGGYGYLVLHTWSNNTTDDLTPFDFLWADLHVSAGDNFRFGMHTGVPFMYSLNSSTNNPIGRYRN